VSSTETPRTHSHSARFPGEAASDAERDARIGTVLYEEGATDVIVGKVRELLEKGTALRNIAVYVERSAQGEHMIVAGYRTAIADVVMERAAEKLRVGKVVEMLNGRAQKGNVFCVFVLWREDGLADVACVELTTKAET
jgi:hypothetical protein